MVVIRLIGECWVAVVLWPIGVPAILVVDVALGLVVSLLRSVLLAIERVTRVEIALVARVGWLWAPWPRRTSGHEWGDKESRFERSCSGTDESRLGLGQARMKNETGVAFVVDVEAGDDVDGGELVVVDGVLLR